MATQSVNPQQNPQTQNRKRLLQRAERLFESIGAYSDAGSVDELRTLHSYLSQFLALPDDVLHEWDNLGATQ